MSTKNYRALIKEKGFYPLTKSLFKKTVKLFADRKIRLLVQFKSPSYPLILPENHEVEIKEVQPEEAPLISKEIAIRPNILRERWEQGAKMYGAFWEGKIVYYAWIFIGDVFHDKTDGFYLNLNRIEAYCFDYKGATTLSPRSFRSFRLIKALIWVMIKNEEKKLEGKPLFYALIGLDNMISLNFHLNILQGKVVAVMRHYHLFGWKWSVRKSLSAS